MPQHVEEAVGRAKDFADGALRQVSIGGADVLVVRTGGVFHAVHAYCSHYGAPLAEGVLSEGRVVCPWHHACFDLATGRQLEPPGWDGLYRFDTHVDDGQVYVRVPAHFDAHPPATPAPPSADEDDEETFVVLGGGAAGAHAAEALRESGFAGRLVLVSAGSFRPYDRVTLSKEFLGGQVEAREDVALRSDGFYAARGIEVEQGRRVVEVDAQARCLTFEDGQAMAYDTLILCTGGTPRKLDVEGAGLGGIYTLRSLGDAEAIRAAARSARRAVVVGASFIGMEGASALRHLRPDLPITVVAPGAVPFAPLLGEEVGRMLQALHKKNGIAFRLGEKVARFEGEGAVEKVVLQSGDRLRADLVLVGIGVEPATGFLKGVELADDGGVVVDEHLRAADGLYAAGDIAHVPDARTGRRVRIEHWRVACQHGRQAAKNAAGAQEPFRAVPFFWSAQHGSSLRYVGHAPSFDEVMIEGNLYEEKFIAYYVENGTVQAAFGMGRDPEMAALAELMRRDLLPPLEKLRDGSAGLVERLRADAG